MSQPNNKSNKNIRDEARRTIWVQCENPKCMKWRKVSKSYCEDFSNINWFCFMNPDPSFSKCDIDQEKMHVPRGETVIFSELNVGALVWAKMAGYPRWPGIISADPCDDDCTNYISRYEDGTNDPKYYHIEFLGEPHSHAWVPARSVELYNVSTVDLCFTEKSMKRKALRVNFQNSLKEAIQLHKLAAEERLSRCVYTYKKLKRMGEGLHSYNSSKVSKKSLPKQINAKENQSPCIENNGMFVNINGIVYPVIMPTDKCSNDEKSTNPVKYSKKQKKFCGAATVRKSEGRRKKRLSGCDAVKSKKLQSGERNSSPEMFKEKTIHEPPDVTGTNQKVMKKTAANDEDEFWHTYQSYCNRKNIKNSTRHITWYNKTIDLFTFYKSVQRVGGYNQAASHWKIWRGICCDILGVNTDSQFRSLRKAYRQVLLQFEMDQKRQTAESFKTLSITSSNIIQPQQHFNSIPGAYPKTKELSISQQLSPVYKIQGRLIPDDHDTSQDISNLVTVAGDVQPEAVLKGALPMLPVKHCHDVFALTSSNPQSPHHMYITHDETMTYDLNLDVALQELDNLEQQLHCMTQYSQSSPVCSSDSEEINNASYQPISGSPNIKELNDVLGELTDVEDTLLELTGDILNIDCSLY